MNNDNKIKLNISRATDNPWQVEIIDASNAELNLANNIIDCLKTIFDPELPVNIYDLGLINKINIDADNNVIVEMTLTTPGCPVAQTFPGEIQAKLSKLDNINSAQVELVWEPAWSQSRLSIAVKLQLGII